MPALDLVAATPPSAPDPPPLSVGRGQRRHRKLQMKGLGDASLPQEGPLPAAPTIQMAAGEKVEFGEPDQATGSLDTGSPAATPTAAFLRGQDFIRRCIAGDPGMRDEFVTQYGALVRYAVATVLRSQGVALLAEELDDLVHSVLVSFFDRDCRRLKMYEGRNQASFATFVRVCSTRQALDYLRSRRRRPPIAEVGGDDDGFSLTNAPDLASGPEDRAAASEGLERLRTAVATLPAREQLLVRLHFVLGCDVAEVAAALNVSENAVHVLKSRVKAKLRGLVRLEDDDD